MHVKLFVGNMPWSINDVELEDMFSPHGEVQSARVIIDRKTGRSRGFGFVEMETSDPAAVINATNGLEVGGRALRVNEAEEKSSYGGGPHRSGGGRGDRDRGRGRGDRRDRY